jgi:N-glycosylase/DNA lyase
MRERGEGVGGPKHGEWTESLALCILCATNWARRELNSIKKISQQLIVNNSKNTTVYTIRFADFLVHIARGKLTKFPPAIVPIPVRTRKINPKF